MPNYRYKSRDALGKLVEGLHEAANKDQVAAFIVSRGLTPIDIQEKKETLSLFDDVQDVFSSNIGLEELVIFSRQMYSLMQAGIPVMRAIAGLRDSASNKLMNKALTEVLNDLEAGRALSSAMASQPRVFSKIVISLVHVGENTGQLDEAFMQLAEYLEKEQETRKQIKAAMRYPSFVLVFLVAAVVILNIKVIPVFAKMFDKFGVELPWTTRALLATSDFFVNYWHLMGLALIGVFIWIKSWLGTENGRLTWDRNKLKIPFVGSIIERALLARFGRSFAMMMAAGVPLLHGLSLVSEAVDNAYMGSKIKQMGSGIRTGESLLRVSAQSTLFNALVLQMIAVGEETGRIEQLMTSMAQYYEREVDFDLKSLTAKIEPVLISVVAAMVLILALGIFTPMWDMMSAMKK